MGTHPRLVTRTRAHRLQLEFKTSPRQGYNPARRGAQKWLPRRTEQKRPFLAQNGRPKQKLTLLARAQAQISGSRWTLDTSRFGTSRRPKRDRRTQKANAQRTNSHFWLETGRQIQPDTANPCDQKRTHGLHFWLATGRQIRLHTANPADQRGARGRTVPRHLNV